MSSRRISRPRLASVVVVGAVLALAACGGGGTSTAPSHSATASPTASVQLTPVAQIRLGAMQGNYGFPTPFAALRGPGKMLSAQIFDPLVWPDGSGKMQPWLATAWKHSADGLTWTFTLRNGVKFQDGTPLTIDDVLFSYQYVMKGGPGATAAPAPASIGSVSAPDANTFVITLSRPDPVILDEVGGSGGPAIIPKRIWAPVTDPVKFRGPTSLIGSGPYKLTQYDLTAGSYLFVANNDFFLGRPIVQKVVYLPTGTTDPLLLMQQGELDAGSANNTNIPDAQFNTLTSKFKLLTAPGEQGIHLYFNLNKGFPYDNRNFRQAVAYAINRTDMVKRQLMGRGVPGSVGGLGPANAWLDKSLPEYTFNLPKAKTLLDQAGLVDTDGDGIRNLPAGGANLRIPLLTSSADVTSAQLVAEYLRAAGLQADVQAVDQASMDATATKGGYSMSVIHFGGLSGDPGTGLCTRMVPTTTRANSFSNTQGYSNPTVSSLCAKIQTTMDVTTRAQMINQVQSLINQDVPAMPLFISNQMAFVDTNVFKAFAYTPGCPPCGATNNKFMLVTGRTTAK